MTNPIDTAIKAFEEAECGSRELDAMMGAIVLDPHYNPSRYPHYTTNLQDAVDAIPAGLEYMISTIHGFAEIHLGINLQDGPIMVTRADGNVCLAMGEAILTYIKSAP